jgi:outer membrane protein assembly factor BamA
LISRTIFSPFVRLSPGERRMKICLSISLVVALIGLCFLPASHVFAQEKLIEDLELRGYRSVTREEILKNVKSEPGKPFDLEQAKRDLSKILEMGIFDRLRCKMVIQDGPRGGVILIFDLKELPKKQ